jgi:hypothetical protein
MAKWTCKGRVRQWLQTQNVLRRLIQTYHLHSACITATPSYLHPAFNNILRAITVLMLEAHKEGYERGYREGRKSHNCNGHCSCRKLTKEQLGAIAYNSQIINNFNL